MEPVRQTRLANHHKFKKILENCRVRLPDGQFNFVSLFNPACRLSIDGCHDEFMRLYGKLYQDYPLGIAEIQGPYTHVLIDVDIKVEHGNSSKELTFLNERLYSQEQLKRVVSIYQHKLKETLYNPTDPKCMEETKAYMDKNASALESSTYLKSAPVPDFTAFVLEKPHSYSTKGYMKSGFHIHFPHIVLSVQHFKGFIHSQTSKLVQATIPNAVDDDISTKPVLMYGSRKSIEMEAYRLTQIFDERMNSVSVDIYFKDKTNGIALDEYLPRFLTMNTSNKPSCVVKPFLTTKMVYTREIKLTDDYTFEYDFMQNREEVTNLLNMLSDDRATARDKWIEVGWVIFNISGASKEGYDLWIEFSKRTKIPSQFDDAVCAYEWGKMKKGKYTIRTLRYFASIDSPERYKQYRRGQIKEQYILTLRDTDTDFAEMLYLMYGDIYKCGNIEKDLWYFFHNHRWHRMNGAYDLRGKIDKELKYIYINFIGECKRKCTAIERYISKKGLLDDEVPVADDSESDTDDTDEYANIMQDIEGKDADELTAEIENINVQTKKAGEIIKMLGSGGKKTAIIKECRFKFYDQYFCDMLDTNPYLIGFTNGVYDLQQMQFRDGRPIDYISKCTNYDYKELTTRDEFAINEFENFMLKVYPDPELREFVWQNDASNLVGGNFNKLFVIHSGPKGNNSKSCKQNALEYAFGDYCVHLPTSLIVGKRSASNAATPELCHSVGARIAYVQEPDAKDVFSVGIIKELSGNTDAIYIRGLFSEGKEVVLMFKLYMVCNYLPSVNTSDPAFWNRVLIIPYESVFVPQDLCPETFEEQLKQKIFPEDKNISVRLKELKHVYMWLLIKKYKDMQTGKCKIAPVPACAQYATRSYRESTDTLGKFVSLNYIVGDTNNINVYVELDEMFKSYKLYLSDMGFSTKVDITEFTFCINSRFKVIGDHIIGLQPKVIRISSETDIKQANDT